jgi:phosphate regulon transcriptional regulator PhoB
MDPKPTVLVVEDEKDIRELVRFHLEQEGYLVREADSGEGLTAHLQAGAPDLVLLDIMLPGTDGLTLCRRLRASAATAGVPIIMLTAKAAEVDRVLGLEMGADDYVTKPFSPRELVARVKAVMRRARPAETGVGLDIYERGRLRIDFDSYELFLGGQRINLSLREFELMKFFARNPYKAYDRLQLLDLVWGQEVHVEPRTVDVHVRRLRKQIERNDAVPELILTVRGVGYRFNPDALDQ